MTARSLFRLAAPALLAGAVLLVGCETDRTTTFEPVGPNVFDFTVSSGATALPGGSARRQATLNLTAGTSDLGGGVFNNRLLETPDASASVIVVALPATTLTVGYGYADPDFPGKNGYLGTYTIRMDFVSTTSPTNIAITMQLARVDATGAVQASGPVSGVLNRNSTSNPGVLTFTFANLNLGTWAAGDRLRVSYRFQNSTATARELRLLASAAAPMIIPTRSVTITANNLRAVGGTKQYQFWVRGDTVTKTDVAKMAYGRVIELFNEILLDANGDPVLDPITGEPVLVGDSRVVSDVPVNFYRGTDDTTVTAVRLLVDSVADGTAVVDAYAVVISLEDAPATEPGPAQFLWKRTGLSQTGAAPAAESMFFGTYGGSDYITANLAGVASPLDYVFPSVGSGLGGVRGDELSVDFTSLGRPPVGFFYRGFLVAADGSSLMVDTLRSAWDPDPTLSRVNLHDADVNDLLPGVLGREIRKGQVRNCVSGSGVLNCQNSLTPTPAAGSEQPFANYPIFQLMLDPKGSDVSARWRSATAIGALPENARR